MAKGGDDLLRRQEVRNQKTMVCFIIVVLLGVFLISGCKNGTPEKIEKPDEIRAARQAQLRNITVYFASPEGYMVPITYSFSKPVEDPAAVAIDKLLDGPNSDFLVRTLPQGTRLKNCYISNDTALVDFSEEFYRLSDSNAANTAVKSLCLTMGSIPGVEHVQLLVDGRPVKEIQGVSMGELLKLSYVNYAGSGEAPNKYLVYYAASKPIYMVPVTYASDTPENLPRKALEKLAAGPGREALYATLWPGTKILGLKIENGLATVNLSKEAVGYGGGTTAEGLFVKSLLLTLGQFSDIKEVQILLEGQKTELLPEGTEIGMPLEPPAYANYAEGE